MARVAFGSCTRYQGDREQKVWARIAEQQPDWLLLLGDQVYLDFGVSPFGDYIGKPRKWNYQDFVEKLHGHYREQYGLDQFGKLLDVVPRGQVVCIWDDHDFAWDGAVGGEVEGGVPDDKRRASRLLLQQYRDALRDRPDDYPGLPACLLNPMQLPDPGGAYQAFSVDGLRFVVPDLRTWSHRPGFGGELLGPVDGEQDAWLAGELSRAGEVVIGSSLTLTVGTCWARKYRSSYDRLLARLATKRALVLSGDIHENRWKTHRNPHGHWPIHEATSSGLSIYGFKPWRLGLQSNSGLLDIEPDRLTVRLYCGKESVVEEKRVIDRRTWQCLPPDRR